MTTARRITVSVICVALVAAAIVLAVLLSGAGDRAYAAGVFDYVGAIKAVGGSTEGGRRGLRLYGYDSGVTANFKNTQTDVFSAELQIGSFDGKRDLKKYSLVFTDVKSGKSFSVQVTAYSDYSDVGVVYDGVKGGIVYMERKNAAYGLTAGYNADGVYTRFTADICSLMFDPASMQVRMKADDGNYRVVWDFTKPYNDGKLLANDLPKFGEYTVSVVFDEVSANSRGDLMLYSFGGYSLTDEIVSYRPTVLMQKGIKPVVGDAFTLPTARITDADGKDASDKITATVYDADGTVLAENVRQFTPQKAGVLYVYYAYTDGETTADLWYRTEVLDAADIAAKFVYDGDEIPGALGVGARLRIPAATVTSNVLEINTEDCLVTIRKDGVAMNGYVNIPAGFVWEVTEPGRYEIVYGGALSGLYKTESKAFTADDTLLAVNTDIAREFVLGSVYRFGAAEFCLGAARAQVSATVVFPSGREADGEVTLDEVGKYKVIYRATLNGTEYTHSETVTVKKSHADDFDSAAEFTHMRGNNEFTGVRLSLSNNQTVTYNKTIDLSDFTFDSSTNRGKTLLELNFDPQNIGSTDIDSFYVMLTDAHDPTNYVSIRLKYLVYSPTATFIRARASNQANWVGYYYDFSSTNRRVDAAATHEEGGFVSSASFTHVLDEYDFGFGSLKLYFDYETKCLYAQPEWLTGHDDGSHPEYNTRQVPWLVYDFDTTDGTLSAGNKPWGGFTTGEAILSVYAKGVSGTTDVFVRNVGGEDLTTALFDDTKAPDVTIDVDRNHVPAAKVGVSYPIFDFTATDADSPVVSRGVTIIHDATGRQITQDENNCFTPIEGTYTLTYYAVDAFGYRTEETVRVVASRNVEAPKITVAAGLPGSAYYGQTLTLADYEIVSAGVGNAKVRVTVTCGDVSIPVVNGKFDCIGAVGTYTVTYTVTDHIGQTASVRKKIAVSLTDALQFDEGTVSLPKAFINGDKVIFGQYAAVYYNEKLEKITVHAVISVTDGQGTTTVAPGQIYVPTATDDVTAATVTLRFAADGKTHTVTRTIPIRTVENGEDYMTGYFVWEGAAPTLSSNGLVFAGAEGTDMRFSFARPICANTLLLRFIADADRFAASSFDVTLTDCFDGREQVNIRYTLRAGTWYCSVAGGKAVETSSDGDGYLQLGYDNATCTFVDGSGRTLGSVDAVSGETFDGFTGGYVYMDCRVTGVGGTTTVGIRTINNQTINSVKRDMQRPSIRVGGKYEGRVAAGSTITLLPATAYDVLNALGDITVSVKIGSRTVLAEHTSVPGETFTASECGTYTILYKVTDAAKNTVTEKVEFAAYDPVRPTLTFSGDVAGEAKVGETIGLPRYTVSDDIPDSVTVYVYVMAPDGTKTKLTGDSLTLEKAGTYVITYLVTDVHNNVTLYRFVITAK